MIVNYYEGDSILHRMNPAVKLAATLACLIGLTLVFDPYVPLILLGVLLLTARGVAGVPLRTMIAALLPFTLLALGFFWMQVAFPRGDATAYRELARYGPITVYHETLLRGAALGLRVICYAAYGLLFAATTDPTRLVLSLIQQARLSPRFGYGVLAAYRFFPLYQSEFQTLRAAHRIRGADERKGWAGRVERLKRYAIPLLAGAVRRAERVAIAMESRGFTGDRQRTYYTAVPVGALDWLLAAGYLVVTLLAVALVYRLGLLQLWYGSLYF